MIKLTQAGLLLLPRQLGCGYSKRLVDFPRYYLHLNIFDGLDFGAVDELPEILQMPALPTTHNPGRLLPTYHCLLFHLMQVAVCNELLCKDVVLLLSMDRKNYSGACGRNRFGANYQNRLIGHDEMLKLVKHWQGQGLIEIVTGGKPEGSSTGFETRIMPLGAFRDALVHLFQQLQLRPLEPLYHGLNRSRQPASFNAVVVRTSRKNKTLLYSSGDATIPEAVGEVQLIRQIEQGVVWVNNETSKFQFSMTSTATSILREGTMNINGLNDWKGEGREGRHSIYQPSIMHPVTPPYVNLIPLPGQWFQYHRVMHDSIENSGRWYAPFQSKLKSDERKLLLINGKATVEVDYSNFHPRLIYHLNGVDPDKTLINIGFSATGDGSVDLYRCPGTLAPRKICKLALNIIIFSNSKIQAIQAISNIISSEIAAHGSFPRHKNDDKKWHVIIEEPFEQSAEDMAYVKELEGLDAEAVYEWICHDHSMISEYFCQANGHAWKMLQAIDSDIADKIMTHFLLKGRPCVCIHDSFRVWAEDEQELIQVMIERYQNVTGTKFIPHLKSDRHLAFGSCNKHVS